MIQEIKPKNLVTLRFLKFLNGLDEYWWKAVLNEPLIKILYKAKPEQHLIL